MKINENIYYTPTFKAGKVRVFSDFDRTFLPSSHNDFARNYDIRFVEVIRANFKNFKEFLNRTRDGLKFTITTGRTFGEFQTMAEISRERNFGMPFPDTLIVKNGSDEHLRVGTDEDFYNGGAFPFKYDVTNKEKEENIKKLTNWDGPLIKEKIKELFKAYNMRIVEGDSEHSPGNYGSRSLFTSGKLHYETNKVFHGSDKADWSVGFRNDGNCKIFFTYPYDMHCVDERCAAYQDLREKINRIFQDNNIKFHTASSSSGNKKECGGRPWDVYEPEIIEAEFRGHHDYGLSKVYDVREAVKLAQKNNDLVIAAGDGSNDAFMLNPGTFFKDYLNEEMLKRDSELLNKLSRPELLIKILDSNPDLAENFIKMPFVGIIVIQHNGTNNLEVLTPFTKGKYKKLIIVDEGKLQNGIKEAIKLYSEQNPEYKENLNKNLADELKEGEKTHDSNRCPPDDKDNENENKNSNKIWLYIAGGAGLGLAGGIYLARRNKKEQYSSKIREQSLNIII